MSYNLSNWREPEQSTASFQNINKLFNTQEISKGSKEPKLQSKPIKTDDFKIDVPEKGSIKLDDFIKETDTDGLIVLKNDDIVYEFYGDKTSGENMVHIIFSITKSVTGLVCGILVDRGVLDTEALVTKYVPEMKGTPYEDITVRQCLDMRTGIQYDDASPEYRKAGAWMPFEEGEKQKDLHDFLSEFRAERTPKIDGLDGYPFEYLSVNTDLIGWVIERATGKKYAELVTELIWQPMGADKDAYVTLDRNGNARPAGGGCTSLRDLARFGQIVLQHDNGIVPASWIHDMLNNGSKEAFDAGSWKERFEKVFGEIAYRSYWVANKSNDILIGLGVHGQILCVDRKNGIVMAKMSSQGERVSMEKMTMAALAFKEFQRLLTKS